MRQITCAHWPVALSSRPARRRRRRGRRAEAAAREAEEKAAREAAEAAARKAEEKATREAAEAATRQGAGGREGRKRGGGGFVIIAWRLDLGVVGDLGLGRLAPKRH